MDIQKIGFTKLTGWENNISEDHLIEWLNGNASYVNHGKYVGDDDITEWIFKVEDFYVTEFEEDADDMKWLHKKADAIQIKARDCDYIGITL